MKQKKLVYLFLVISISFTLFLPILNLVFATKNTKNNLQIFSKKQLFSTDNLESIINYFVYKTFNFSVNEPQVIAGKDGFLFLGNSYSNIIDKTKGTFPYTHQQIDSWTTKLQKLQNWYEKQGIEFIIVVAPNKHTIYSDKLPDGILYNEEKTITDDIVKSSRDKAIHILNLKNVLRAKKKDKQLYFKTDTHWNNYGALIGYMHTMQYLNTTYNKNYKIPKYSMKALTSHGGGDLTNFLKINHFLSQNNVKNYKFIFEKKNKICYGKITKTNQLEKCSPSVKGGFNQYMINKNAPNKEKLLYICDSFGLENSHIYEETFHTVWRIHHTYMNGKVLAHFIQEHKPDIIIYQIVERDIGSNHTVADMPQ